MKWSFPVLKHSPRNQVALLLSLMALVLLVPGVALSMLNISTTGAVDAPMANFDINFFDTSNSLLSTVSDLFEQGYYFVSVMIFIFSVIVPTAKVVLLIQMLVIHDQALRAKILNFAQSMGKWSMCDVFIVAIFLAYLSTGSKATDQAHEASVLGIPFDINVLVNMNASLDTGFYCFLGYCLLSLAAAQLFHPNPHHKKEKPVKVESS